MSKARCDCKKSYHPSKILGAMDVLCRNKTGTLTEDKIALVKYVNAEGAADEKNFDYAYNFQQFPQRF